MMTIQELREEYPQLNQKNLNDDLKFLKAVLKAIEGKAIENSWGQYENNGKTFSFQVKKSNQDSSKLVENYRSVKTLYGQEKEKKNKGKENKIYVEETKSYVYNLDDNLIRNSDDSLYSHKDTPIPPKSNCCYKYKWWIAGGAFLLISSLSVGGYFIYQQLTSQSPVVPDNAPVTLKGYLDLSYRDGVFYGDIQDLIDQNSDYNNFNNLRCSASFMGGDQVKHESMNKDSSDYTIAMNNELGAFIHNHPDGEVKVICTADDLKKGTEPKATLPFSAVDDVCFNNLPQPKLSYDPSLHQLTIHWLSQDKITRDAKQQLAINYSLDGGASWQKLETLDPSKLKSKDGAYVYAFTDQQIESFKGNQVQFKANVEVGDHYRNVCTAPDSGAQLAVFYRLDVSSGGGLKVLVRPEKFIEASCQLRDVTTDQIVQTQTFKSNTEVKKFSHGGSGDQYSYHCNVQSQQGIEPVKSETFIGRAYNAVLRFFDYANVDQTPEITAKR